MKDSADASGFIRQQAFLRERLLATILFFYLFSKNLAMDVYADDEAVFCLFLGLPATHVWQQSKSGLGIQRISWDHDAFMSIIISTSFSTESNPLTLHTFESCAARIIPEASRLVDMQIIASSSHAESERAHAERAAIAELNTDPITRPPKHMYNAGGVFCTTPGCGRGDHAHDHCDAKGGGMEGQAPWQRKKKKLTGTHAAVFATSVSAMIPVFATPANPALFTLISHASTGSTFWPLISPSPPNIVTHVISTILDCSTLLTLIRACELFGRIPPPILSLCARPMSGIYLWTW
ncbi:uncharacterized protein BJ212DRAFT_912320 [Suillus subaureus]|uniref:Uncharacterized protein n=1 Tax=Suillus subaureus TaxID=48587 RepID=A0A9P7EH40_9AGAM|nr:uncharacterized protein BJ212DRAFT_912320 [Suillus subaureus]KAG1821640.1 hypothetical protein BJ212DRAFT_912320 [Suillus subaureus]